MRASYPGDLGQDVLGVLAGPDSGGKLYEAVSAVYDVDNDKTEVEWRPLSPEDTRNAVKDPFGIWRIVDGDE